MKMKQSLLLGACALMLLASCGDNRPEYKQRINPPYTVMENIKGYPKKIEYKAYLSADDMAAGRWYRNEVVEVDPKGYEVSFLGETEGIRELLEYTYDTEKAGKILSFTNHVEYATGGSGDYLCTCYYDEHGNMTRRLKTKDGVPYDEILITIDEKKYPVEKKYYENGKTGDDWYLREEYKYNDEGNLTEIISYSDDCDKPFKKVEVIDDTAYMRYFPSVEWNYDENGELRYANRNIYNDDMLIIGIEKTEDGKTWNPLYEYTINSNGNTATATYHSKDGVKTTNFTYTYDPQGNWITKTDGDAIYVREIEYY